ncbi:stimulator of interferon genes protein isoform X1 [Drosophila novamexicana]|uniref:stimulator of interferon genes protein isoform X1 n=1 Tax=Drosophila novamexicana TaxID=47314 RepID=UPI0011E5F54D|nr:stimulator of interferon genes protein isoform X1 [Drosophila novamexicana]
MAIPSEDQRNDKKFLCPKMIGEYIDNCIRIFIVVFVADFMQRLFYMSTEYLINGQYYLLEDRAITIVKRAFSYHRKAVFLILGLAFAGLARFGSTGNLTPLLPKSAHLIYIPLYWIFSYAQLSHSSLSYAHWIRESHGLDYAAGMASNYFHGYLKLSLPERGHDGLQKRMQAYEDTNNVRFGLNRLIILIPDEMFVKGVIESSLLEKAHPLETQFINRAGVNRPFKHAVYRLTKQINGTTYYFAMEGATPMLSFFDSMNFQLSATWQMQEMKREIWLKFYKHLKELLNTWPETRREVELIIYNSHKTNGEPVDVGEILYAHVLTHLNNKKVLN